jgi:hypothetical protein
MREAHKPDRHILKVDVFYLTDDTIFMLAIPYERGPLEIPLCNCYVNSRELEG